MIILAVDLGERRVGYAICDIEEIIASPLKTDRVRTIDQAMNAVLATMAETNAERVVVGFPRNMNGKLGPKAKESQAFVESLLSQGLDAVLWDERLTTSEAERSLKDANLSRRQRKSHIDAVAAQRILQSYLAAIKNRQPE